MIGGGAPPRPPAPAAQESPRRADPSPPPPPAPNEKTTGGGGDEDDDLDDEDKTPRARPVDPDKVMRPGERDDDDEEDPEADEFFADTLAAGAVAGVIKGVNKRLGKRNPPERSRPHPTTSRWAAEGLAYRLEKLMGRKAIGPNAKIALGFGGIIVTMLLNAEPIPPTERPYAAPAPSPRPAPNGAAGHAPAVTRELVRQEVASAMRDDVPTDEGKPAAEGAAAVGTFRKQGAN